MAVTPSTLEGEPAHAVSGSDCSLIHPVVGEMFVYFPHSYVGGLTSRVAIFGDGALKKVIKV